MYSFRDYIKDIIKSSMDNENANLAMSIVYGDTIDLDKGIIEDFEQVGVSHLMSVSGTHITSFMVIINVMLGKQDFKKKSTYENKNRSKRQYIIKIKWIMKIICICLYVIFTGGSISILRASIMLILRMAYDLLKKSNNRYKTMLIALLVILLHSPFAIFNIGTLFSFLATLGIIMFNKDIVEVLTKIICKVKNKYIYKILKYLLSNTAITISVQLMIIPIQIQAFNRLPMPVIIPNLILGIASLPTMVIGTVGIVLSFIPVLSCKIFSFLELFIEALIYLIKIFKSISFGICTVSMPVIFFVIYYVFILGLFICFKLKRITNNMNKHSKYNFKKLYKHIKIFELSVLIILIILVVFLNIYSMYFSQYVYFFNVEQGDMSYVKCGKQSIIVDIGSQGDGVAFNTISNYFKIANLNEVDAIVVSHMHKDHVNGLEKFFKKYKVGTVIYSRPKTISKSYIEFKKLLKMYSVNGVEVKAGDEFVFGKIKIRVLLPDEEYILSDEENANSLVCSVTIGNSELLYMGDASSETEEKLIKEVSNISGIYILKVGHHGSKTATSKEFIEVVKPQNAVISALKKYYGHPHEQTLETLKENDVYVYLTEKQGAIKFSLK